MLINNQIEKKKKTKKINHKNIQKQTLKVVGTPDGPQESGELASNCGNVNDAILCFIFEGSIRIEQRKKKKKKNGNDKNEG